MKRRRNRTELAAAVAGLVAILCGAGSAAGAPRMPATVHDLFSPPLTIHAEISPSGRHAASIVSGKLNLGVRIQHIESGDSIEVFSNVPGGTSFSITQILWDGPDSLIVEYAWSGPGTAPKHPTYYEHFALDPVAPKVVFERKVLGTRGEIVDPSPARPGEVLFAHAETPRSVHRAKLALLERRLPDFRQQDAKSKDAPVELARIDEAVLSWLVDREGEVRAALAFVEEPLELRLLYRGRGDSRWEIVRRETDFDRFEDLVPLGFSADGHHLLVASALERDRYGLYEYDPAKNELGRLLYEHATAELTDLVFDADRHELLAAVYREDGEQRYAYLSSGSEELKTATAQLFPDSVVEITGTSANRRRYTLFVSRSNDPGGYVVYDLDTKKVVPVGRVAPWLDDDLLAEVEVIDVPNPKGKDLEAFLTLPPLPEGKPPLVVMPHGGPIGIADLRGYSGDVQYLARSGFAVLQVNYRGSGGYGRSFREAGHRQWGRGIEDDIETAVDHVLAGGRVDGTRMCVIGASYGGYSALMMVIREPKKYRCAASLSGVTDIALMFNVDEVTGGELLTLQMEKLVGDPERDYEEMRRYSPVYRADEIEVPIFLAHGALDRTVDLDHLIRMKLALDLAKVPAHAVVYAKMGHGFSSRDAAVRHWLSIYEFLAEHLKRGEDARISLRSEETEN